jgi:hypothetical protein
MLLVGEAGNAATEFQTLTVLIGHLAWPVVALIVAWWFYEPATDLARALRTLK